MDAVHVGGQSVMMENVVAQIFTYFNSYFLFVACIMIGQVMLCPYLKKKRSHFAVRTISAIALAIGMSVLCYFLNSFAYQGVYNSGDLAYGWYFVTNISIYILMWVSCILAFYLVIEVPFREVIVISAISYLAQHLAYQLNELCFSMATNQYIWSGLYNLMGLSEETTSYTAWIAASNAVTTLDYLAVNAIVYTLFYFFFAKRFKANYRKVIKNSTVFYFVIATMVFAIIFNSVFCFYGYTNYVAHAIVCISFMFIILLLFVLILSNYMLRNTEDELFTTETYYKEKLKQYEETKKSIELLNIKAHDLKKEVETLQRTNENMSEESLKAISDAIADYEYTFDTGNRVLDVLLTDRAGICRSRGIELTAIIDGNSLSFMRKGETFSLFSNILDNAIEAVSKLENPEEKIISLSVKKEKGFIKIVETNYFAGSVEFENGMPLTSKGDKENHGYGTKSIAYVVDQLKGRCRFETDRNVFALTILIPTQN